MLTMPQIPDVHFKESHLPEVGFEVIDLASIYRRHESGNLPFANVPHRITFHNLLLITQGTGEHLVDFHQFPVSKGSIVFINKGQVHKFDTKQKPQGKLIVFTEEYIQRVTSNAGIQILPPTHFISSALPSFRVDEVTREQLAHLIQLIESEFHAYHINIKYLQTLLAALLIKTSEGRPDIYHSSMKQYQVALFNRFITLLEQNYSKTRDANDYAELLGTTYKTLNKLCKLVTNKTAKQLIDAYTILEAKRRLIVEKYQIQQLSESLGFDEPSNFVKYFKKHTLMTPSQFRNSN
ncbi:AraC family transcriptional regulator [Shewanella aquimarina]|uniref:AraC family transcriptional regulator n=1 Tax=Shewanella aquimarina TaxID=260365 RepID=UPI002014B365|nr:helix-turn-helix transcriptional regulator [Shewanella aquimarina]MCL2912078.1 helix-turn-helix transcriptional regulator [Shewanella aquimarina]